MRAPRSPEHLAFLLELSIIHSLYGVIHIGMPLLFLTYGGYCVASLFNMVACYSLSLLWQAGLEIISGESPDTMTGQIHFSSVMYRFWPVKLLSSCHF